MVAFDRTIGPALARKNIKSKGQGVGNAGMFNKSTNAAGLNGKSQIPGQSILSPKSGLMKDKII